MPRGSYLSNQYGAHHTNGIGFINLGLSHNSVKRSVVKLDRRLTIEVFGDLKLVLG